MTIPPKIIRAVRAPRRFTITSHIRADGDSIGSAVAMLHVLRGEGKEAQIVMDSAVPKAYQFLDIGHDVCTDPDALWDDADVVLVLDCADVGRLGRVGERIAGHPLLINIDHHLSNTGFGRVNWVEDSSCTGEMLYGLFRDLGYGVPKPALDALFTAIVTDTGRFTHGNTSSSCMDVAAALVRAGARPSEINSRLYRTEPFAVVRLKAAAAGTLELWADGQIATMCLTRQMFHDTGVDPIDTQDFADVPRSVEGVEVGVLLRELDDQGNVKVSLRSMGKVNVNAVAGQFDGGGHFRASGCEMSGGLDRVKETLVALLSDAVAQP